MRRAIVAAWLCALLGCTPQARMLELSGDALAVPAGKRAAACTWRLAAVEDARPQGDRAGMQGLTEIRLADVEGSLSQALADRGLVDAQAGRELRARLRRLYLRHEEESRIVVAVIEVQPQGAAPLIVREQATQMLWSANEDSARRAFARVLAQSADTMVDRLGGLCD